MRSCWGPGRFISSTAIVWHPGDGPGDTYVKRHPVPFGEYVPARSFFRNFSADIDRVTDQYAGNEVGVLDLGGARLGDLICFEVVYDGLVHDVVDGGPGCSSCRPTTPPSATPTRASSSWR